jgi:hypothetical protein
MENICGSMTVARRMAAGLILLVSTSFGQIPAGELKAKIESKVKELSQWSTNTEVVAAVKAHNASLPADAKAMTNEKWKQLTLLDPLVRSYTKNPAAIALKAKKEDWVTECFVSGADGTKVAFLSKTTYWSHADKDKHRIPMAGKTWIGPVEVDESTGLQQVQVALPVLDGGKPIGSIVLGLSVAKLK